MKTKQNINLTVLSTAIMGFIIGASIGVIMYLLEGRLGLIYPYSSSSSSHGVFIIPMGILSAILFMVTLSGSELIQFMRINKNPILTIGLIVLMIGVASAVYDLPGRVLPPTLPDSSPIFAELDESEYNISDVLNSLPDAELNTLYYKVFVPNDAGNQWNQSVEFAESKPYFLLKPKTISGVTYISPFTGRGLQYAWVCCNITKGDRLYTADAINESSLRGTLTNLYNINYKSRFPRDDDSFRNIFIGASTKPNVYNRRGALHLDGYMMGFAMETKNVSVAGVPELMKVFLI